DYWVYATEEDLEELKEAGFYWDDFFEVKQFRITRLQAKFLNPDSRQKILNQMYLVHLKK
ncbi:MAG: glycosyltransferase family 39 protein, partial [Eudoraea sp.]